MHHNDVDCYLTKTSWLILFDKTDLRNVKKWKYMTYHKHHRDKKDYNWGHIINELLRWTLYYILDINMDISNFSYFFSSMQKNFVIAKIGYIFHIFTFFISYWIDSVTSFRFEWNSMQNNTIEEFIDIYAWQNINISRWVEFNITWFFL